MARRSQTIRRWPCGASESSCSVGKSPCGSTGIWPWGKGQDEQGVTNLTSCNAPTALLSREGLQEAKAHHTGLLQPQDQMDSSLERVCTSPGQGTRGGETSSFLAPSWQEDKSTHPNRISLLLGRVPAAASLTPACTRPCCLLTVAVCCCVAWAANRATWLTIGEKFVGP